MKAVSFKWRLEGDETGFCMEARQISVIGKISLYLRGLYGFPLTLTLSFAEQNVICCLHSHLPPCPGVLVPHPEQDFIFALNK